MAGDCQVTLAWGMILLEQLERLVPVLMESASRLERCDNGFYKRDSVGIVASSFQELLLVRTHQF